MTSNCQDELRCLFIVARHSIRAPILYAQNDEFLSLKNFPRGPSYLTEKGIDTSLQVGKIWKRWYPQIFTGNVREVWARCSEAYRCSETAQALLFSIYSSELRYQPVSIIVPPASKDKYTSSNSLSDEELYKFMDRHYHLEIKTKDGKIMSVNEVLDFLKAEYGLDKDTNPYDMFLYLDGLTSLPYENLEQPSSYRENRDLIQSVYNILYDKLTSTLRPYYGFYLLQGLAERMQLVKDGNSKIDIVQALQEAFYRTGNVKDGNKISLFLYHDFSVSAVLTCLNESFEQLRAGFLGGVFFEMYQRSTDGSHYFKLYWTKGLRSDGSYHDKEPLNLKWNNGSNILEFDELWPKLYHNVFEDYMKNNKNALIGYTGEDALV